jgi:hypothetical protein
MDAALASLLSARADALAAGLEAALLAQDAPHYREAAQDERRARVERLVAAFLEGVRAALEAQARPIVAGAGGDTDTVVRRLALVTGIVGRARTSWPAPSWTTRRGPKRGPRSWPTGSTCSSRARTPRPRADSGPRRAGTVALVPATKPHRTVVVGAVLEGDGVAHLACRPGVC